jgi:hypothetical protein
LYGFRASGRTRLRARHGTGAPPRTPARRPTRRRAPTKPRALTLVRFPGLAAYQAARSARDGSPAARPPTPSAHPCTVSGPQGVPGCALGTGRRTTLRARHGTGAPPNPRHRRALTPVRFPGLTAYQAARSARGGVPGCTLGTARRTRLRARRDTGAARSNLDRDYLRSRPCGSYGAPSSSRPSLP